MSAKWNQKVLKEKYLKGNKNVDLCRCGRYYSRFVRANNFFIPKLEHMRCQPCRLGLPVRQQVASRIKSIADRGLTQEQIKYLAERDKSR